MQHIALSHQDKDLIFVFTKKLNQRSLILNSTTSDATITGNGFSNMYAMGETLFFLLNLVWQVKQPHSVGNKKLATSTMLVQLSMNERMWKKKKIFLGELSLHLCALIMKG